MPTRLNLPPWKNQTVDGKVRYNEDVPDGMFLEVFSMISARLVDLNETLEGVKLEIECFNKYGLTTIPHKEPKKLG